jgi:hypothetical protein
MEQGRGSNLPITIEGLRNAGSDGRQRSFAELDEL